MLFEVQPGGSGVFKKSTGMRDVFLVASNGYNMFCQFRSSCRGTICVSERDVYQVFNEGKVCSLLVSMDKYNYIVNDWLLDVPSGSVIHTTSGEVKRLGEYQFRLLMVFAENAGVVLSREELTSMVWARRVIGSNSLPNAIHALRLALNDDGKNQRVIKTLPRKGYILTAEYCRKVAQPDPDASPTAAPEPEHAPETAISAEDDALPAVPDIPEPFSPGTLPLARHYRISPFFSIVMVAMVIAIVFLGFRLVFPPAALPSLRVDRTNEQVFSNIQWFGIVNSAASGVQKENLFDRLKKTLYVLNQDMAARRVTMSVYYQVLDQSLDYSFVLRGPCEKQELVMVIHQWRVDEQRLNDLILNETRRKLSEMATCDKN